MYEELKKYYKEKFVHEHVPYCIKRTSDGSLLYLNNDFITYSFKSSRYCYSYERLFEDVRVDAGDFEVISWAPIENLFEHPEKYFKEDQKKFNYRQYLKTDI